MVPQSGELLPLASYRSSWNEWGGGLSNDSTTVLMIKTCDDTILYSFNHYNLPFIFRILIVTFKWNSMILPKIHWLVGLFAFWFACLLLLKTTQATMTLVVTSRGSNRPITPSGDIVGMYCC